MKNGRARGARRRRVINVIQYRSQNAKGARAALSRRNVRYVQYSIVDGRAAFIFKRIGIPPRARPYA